MTLSRWFGLAAAGVLLILLATVGILYGKARRAEYDADVARSNARAAQDTSKLYHTKYDSQAVVTGRLQEQSAIRERELGGALQDITTQLHLVTKSVQSLDVRVSGIKTTVIETPGTTVVVHDPVTGLGVARKLDFALAGPPINGTIAVTAPFDTTKPGKLDVDLHVNPFALRVSLACDKNKDVQFLTEAPPWVSINVNKGAVEPEVCHGPRPGWFDGLGILKYPVVFLGGVTTGVLLRKALP